MSEPGKILLFQPLVSEGAGLDVRLVGIQAWLGRRLANHGIPGVLVTLPPPEGETEGVTSLVPSDGQIHELMTKLEARWGLFMSFVVLAGRAHLAMARLFELRPDPPNDTPHFGVAKLDFAPEGSDHLPAAAHTLLVAVLQLLGKPAPEETWDQLFGSSDADVVNHHLLALGGFELAQRGHLGPHGEQVMACMLVAIRGGLRGAILGLPVFVETLRRVGALSEPQIANAVREAVAIIGVVPASWHEMMRTAGVSTIALEN
jgi:hypothetical protein